MLRDILSSSSSSSRQEGIVEGAGEAHYRRVEVNVVGCRAGEVMVCRSYEIVDQSPELEGLPSPQYLQVMLSGAAEVGLPEDYQQKLRTHPHNDNTGEVAILSTALQPHPPYSMDAESFLYFAYASNLSKERLNVSCPSAQLVCVARLDDYSIKFVTFRDVKPRWCGAVACAYEKPGGVVWGAVWKISNKDGILLDK